MPKTTKPAGEKKTRTAKTAAELKAQYEKAKAALKALEQRAYAGELDELIKNSKIVAEYAAVKSKVKDVSDLAILAAVGKAIGIKRLEITQKPAVPRKKKVTK
jgi:hypothetical protein